MDIFVGVNAQKLGNGYHHKWYCEETDTFFEIGWYGINGSHTTTFNEIIKASLDMCNVYVKLEYFTDNERDFLVKLQNRDCKSYNNEYYQPVTKTELRRLYHLFLSKVTYNELFNVFMNARDEWIDASIAKGQQLMQRRFRELLGL